VLAGSSVASELPDPTRPELALPASSERGPAAAGFELRAVLIGSARRVAVINGRPVEVGDWIEGAEVLSIEAGRVRLRTPEGERDLGLAGAVSVKPAGEERR
jgi:MSHA biogenesis protein MshK